MKISPGSSMDGITSVRVGIDDTISSIITNTSSDILADDSLESLSPMQSINFYQPSQSKSDPSSQSPDSQLDSSVLILDSSVETFF